MKLIDADKAERDIEELRKSDWFNAPYLSKERKIGLSEAFDMIQSVCIKHAPPVDAIPIEWIEFYISEIEDNVPDVAWAFKELIEIWNEEHLIEQWKKKQEKQNG